MDDHFYGVFTLQNTDNLQQNKTECKILNQYQYVIHYSWSARIGNILDSLLHFYLYGPVLDPYVHLSQNMDIVLYPSS